MELARDPRGRRGDCDERFRVIHGLRQSPFNREVRRLQTVVIQLAGGGTYLPTERAVRGGGYSAIPQSNRVGPPGGQILVDRTVELIQAMWK